VKTHVDGQGKVHEDATGRGKRDSFLPVIDGEKKGGGERGKTIDLPGRFSSHPDQRKKKERGFRYLGGPAKLCCGDPEILHLVRIGRERN